MKKLFAVLCATLLLTSSIVFAHTNHTVVHNHPHECTSMQRQPENRWYFCENCNEYTRHAYDKYSGEWYCTNCTMLPPPLER